MAKAVVALGSNLAGRFASSQAVLEAAIAAFPTRGLSVESRSGAWRSSAWPDPEGPVFLNVIVIATTELAPAAVMRALSALEGEFGRVRAETNAPRTLDLDLIDHDGAVLNEAGLILPHPRAHERRFVLGPLAEIAPDWRHPVLAMTATQLLRTATVGLDARPVPPRCNMST